MLREGKDVSIFASGVEVSEALRAWELLKAEGIDAEVINIHTLKPLDEELVIKSVSKTGCAVTAENGSILNGLGSAVSECLAENNTFLSWAPSTGSKIVIPGIPRMMPRSSIA